MLKLYQITKYFSDFKTVVLVCNTYYILSNELDLSVSTCKLRMKM